jgi:hypothetical protein
VADVGLIRKRLRAEIDRARKSAAARRERAAEASKAYDFFLMGIAIPAFRQMATVLRAEGVPFETQTPSNGVRLVSDRNRDDVIALELDDSLDPPQPMLVSTHSRGSRMLRTERAIKEDAAIESITEDDVIERLIEELKPWLG